MGLGISLALLIYLFNSAMNSPSDSYSGAGGYGDKRRVLHLNKVRVAELVPYLEILYKYFKT